MKILHYSILACIAFVAGPLFAQVPVTSGDFIVEPATLVSLGFEWKITGDDNRNAQVEVTYRPRNAAQWMKALPLMRSQGERVQPPVSMGTQGSGAGYPVFAYTAPNMFVGSILNLNPDTEYE